MVVETMAARLDVLRQGRTAHVVARVVLAERPTSAKPGDTAIVLADGSIEGFVGGSCAESTVRAQSLALLDSGATLLLRISPTPEPAQPGKLSVHNPCLSGGTLEIFLEPVLPSPLVLVVGDTPIARALHRVGAALGYELRTYTGSVEPGAAAVVVASHGRDEEDVLRAALASEVGYVGLVASHARGAAVLASLGLCAGHTARVHVPAGFDIGARTPEEIALSILAEVVASRRSQRSDPTTTDTVASVPTGMAVDPVCHMSVVTVEASLHLDHDGTRVWFCGTGCLRAFAADPAGYLPA